jgi:glutaredoxin
VIKETSYLIYGRSSCPYCVKATQLLDFAGISHDFFDLEDDREFLEEAKVFYNHSTVPIVLRIDGETGIVNLVGGCDDLKGELSD